MFIDTVYEHGTNIMFRNVDTYNSDAGESPKRKNTTFRIGRKFEIKKFPSFVETGFY